MPSHIQDLSHKGLITPPKWLPNSIVYEAMMGSQAYGTAMDNSDYDIHAVVIPPRHVIFPHLRGYIEGFGTPPKRFGTYQQHHIELHPRLYDIQAQSIVKYFTLLMNASPSAVDSLWVPEHAVLYITKIGNMMRDARPMFLSRRVWATFRGYARSQSKKMTTKTPASKRYHMTLKHGYDYKHGSHVVRLMLEAEQLLTTGQLDLLKDREMVKSVKRGDWSLEEIQQWFSEKELALENIWANCTILPVAPDEEAIKELLLNCLEEHYGSLSDAVHVEGRALKAVNEISNVLKGYGYA